jgi:hypothetical protein
MQPIPKPKEYLPSVKIGVFMAIATAVCPFANKWFRSSFDVHVNIFELGAGGIDVTFPYNVTFVLNFIFTALVFNVMFWIALKYLVLRIEGREKLKFVLEACAVGVIVSAAMGVAFHWGLDRANGLYQDVYLVEDTTPVYAYIYFMDEWMGHALQETGILGYFVLLVVAEGLIQKPGSIQKQVSAEIPERRQIHWVELLWIIGIAGVLAVAVGYAALGSESAILLLIACCAFLGIELAYKFLKKASLLQNPLLLATVIANIAVIVQNLVFIGMYGLSPWYPWLRPT